MKDETRQRAWKAILSYAFFSVESALIIALSIALFGLGFAPFEAWQAWYWLVFGAVAEALYLGVTVTDPDANQKILGELLSQRFDPDDIRNPAARDRLKRAIEYQRLIAEAARRFSGPTRRSIETTAEEVGDWVEQIYRLALPLAEEIHLTRVHALVDADTFFPAPDPTEWEEIGREDRPADERHEHPYSFVKLVRVRPA